MPTRQRKRVQLGIIVSRETKRTVERLARESGRSQGQVCEELIEKGLVYDSTLAEVLNGQKEILALLEATRQMAAAMRSIVESEKTK